MAAFPTLIAAPLGALGSSSPLPLAIGMPGLPEMMVILVIALLIFGKRLPEVMRSMGRGVVEFKKGIKGIEEDIEVESSHSARSSNAGSTNTGIQKPAETSSTSEKSD